MFSSITIRRLNWGLTWNSGDHFEFCLPIILFTPRTRQFVGTILLYRLYTTARRQSNTPLYTGYNLGVNYIMYAVTRAAQIQHASIIKLFSKTTCCVE